MHARSTLILAAVVAAVAGAVVFVIVSQAGANGAEHGNFENRFQPVMPARSVAEVDRARQAGIGSIRELRPVEIARQ
jgi:hypothetical protein